MLAGGLPDHPTLILHVDRQRKATRRIGCGQAVGRVASATQAAAAGYCGRGSSSAAEIYFLGFGGRQAPNQGTSDPGCSRGPIPGSQTVHILLCPCGVEGTLELSGASFLTALILFKRG